MKVEQDSSTTILETNKARKVLFQVIAAKGGS